MIEEFINQQNTFGKSVQKKDIHFYRNNNLEVIGARLSSKEALLILVSIAIGVGYIALDGYYYLEP